MKKIYFLFGIHNHQPLGNFEHVMEDAFKGCYEPFLHLLERYHEVKISIHHSGCLLEWIEARHADYIERLRKLVEMNQVEVMGGGFYEPILISIPEGDAIGQIQKMQRFCRERLGGNARGIWLTERIWEPSLPTLLSKGRVEWTLLDDEHFLMAGLKRDELINYYITERTGDVIKVFPIDRFLRYSIPFKEPGEIIDYFRKMAEKKTSEDVIALTYGDDGEKFGIWPGTRKWVYEDGWLERFFGAIIENKDWLETITFSEFIDRFPPKGRIYLPTASYHEMLEWAMPVWSQIRFEDLRSRLKELPFFQDLSPYLKGGLWDNFLAKYGESNRMHKKMLEVSKKVTKMMRVVSRRESGEGREEGKKLVDKARNELWRGQCNCPYWHGLFGGLYLNYLRSEIYKRLISAEKMADSVLMPEAKYITFDIRDYDCDGHEEVLVNTPHFNFYFRPDRGGVLTEFDLKAKNFNITDVLTRRREAYHEKLLSTGIVLAKEEGAPKSIHEIVKSKEQGLEKRLYIDSYERESFIDHIIGPFTNLDNFMKGMFDERGDFIEEPFEVNSATYHTATAQGILIMGRNGSIRKDDGERHPVRVEKTFRFSSIKPEFDVVYKLSNRSLEGTSFRFGVEMNLTLLSGRDPLRYFVFSDARGRDMNMDAKETTDDVEYFDLVDEYQKFSLHFSFDSPSTVMRFPIETISQSEDGFERLYQGTCILISWDVDLWGKEEKELTIHIRFTDLIDVGD